MQSFDLSPSERQELYRFTQDLLDDYYSDTKSYRVSPRLDISEIVDEVRKVDFSESMTPKNAIKHLVEGMKGYSVHTPHPKYFSLYNPHANFPSILGDLITAVFNPQLAAWSHSPFANEIENYLITQFGKKFSYPDESIDGVFASGGAESNLNAVLSAVNNAFPQFVKTGWFGMSKRPVMYCSAESHHSVHKAAKTIGLGYEAIRNIPIRKELKMDLEILKKTIQKDLEIVDPFTHSIQWSRSAYGIKLYLAMMIFGWEGYEKTIRHQTEIGEKLKVLLKNSGWTVMNSSPFPVVCFMDENYVDNPDFTKTVIKDIIDSGKSWLSIYPIFGKPIFRVCITNFNTSEEDIEALVNELNEGRERFGER